MKYIQNCTIFQPNYKWRSKLTLKNPIERKDFGKPENTGNPFECNFVKDDLKEDNIAEYLSDNPEEMEYYTQKIKEYAKQAIQEDRKNVAEHAKTIAHYGPYCDDHTPFRGVCGSCGNYHNPDVLIGESVDKDSIINAPQIELK